MRSGVADDKLIADAERNEAAGTLRRAYLDGKLSEDELDARLGEVVRARTVSQLHDILTGLACRASRRSSPAQRRSSASSVLLIAGVLVLMASGVLGLSQTLGAQTADVSQEQVQAASNFLDTLAGVVQFAPILAVLLFVAAGFSMMMSPTQAASGGRRPRPPASTANRSASSDNADVLDDGGSVSGSGSGGDGE